MTSHTEAFKYLESHFTEEADQEIITDLIESQMISEEIPFKRFYHLYQAQHLAKHGEYLQIELPV